MDSLSSNLISSIKEILKLYHDLTDLIILNLNDKDRNILKSTKRDSDLIISRIYSMLDYSIELLGDE